MTPFERKLRAAGLTQRELADKLGITHPAISRWKNGSAIPHPKLVRKLAKLLRISVDQVLDLFDPQTAAQTAAAA